MFFGVLIYNEEKIKRSLGIHTGITIKICSSFKIDCQVFLSSGDKNCMSASEYTVFSRI